MFERLAHSFARFRPATKESVIRWASHISNPHTFPPLQPGEEIRKIFYTHNPRQKVQYGVTISQGQKDRQIHVIRSIASGIPSQGREPLMQGPFTEILTIRITDEPGRRGQPAQTTRVIYSNSYNQGNISIEQTSEATKAMLIGPIPRALHIQRGLDETRAIMAQSARFIRRAARTDERRERPFFVAN